MTQKVADRCRPSSEQNEDNVVLLLGPKKLYKNEHWEANFLSSDELIFFFLVRVSMQLSSWLQ